MEKELNQQELLAKNLAYYRKTSGLTQLELAEKEAKVFLMFLFLNH